MNPSKSPKTVVKSSPLARVVLIFLLIAASGCTYMQELIGLGVRRPKVTFIDASITRLSIQGIDLLIDLSVENPNSFDLKFAKMNYQLVASGLPVAKGELASKVHVPGEGREVVHLPLSISGEYAVKLMRELIAKPNTPPTALLTANAEFDTPVGPMLVTFEDQRPLHKLTGR